LMAVARRLSVDSEGNRSPYYNPELAAWLGSFEGVPDWFTPQPSELPEDAGVVTRHAHRAMQWLGQMLPGAILAIGLAVAGYQAADWLGATVLDYPDNPVSPILLAILLGLIVRNSIGLPHLYEQGLRLCVKRLLRIGIVLLGIRMSFLAAGQVGLAALPVVIGCILAALCLVTWINRALGLPRRLGSLIAVGTSICGVSAIVATSPVIGADDDETSYAVATIALFGIAALFSYPFLAYWLFGGDPYMAGLFLGTAIHDTSQVAGAGLTFQQQFAAPTALNTAIVVKLVRNLCMVVVIPLMGMLYHRQQQQNANTALADRVAWHQMIPLFVLGFLAMTLLRTVGDLTPHAFGLIGPATWQYVISQTQQTGNWLLAVAMAAVGLNTQLTRLRKLGVKPCVIGLTAALLVGGCSVLLVWVVGPMLG
jgi:uncharacterized integral membrane protein (TIGR00698 family)